jgi:hypothetical protein
VHVVSLAACLELHCFFYLRKCTFCVPLFFIFLLPLFCIVRPVLAFPWRLRCMLSGLETLTTELGKSKEGIVSGPQVALIRPFWTDPGSHSCCSFLCICWCITSTPIVQCTVLNFRNKKMCSTHSFSPFLSLGSFRVPCFPPVENAWMWRFIKGADVMSRTGTSNWVISTFSGHEQIHVSRALMVCWVVIAGFAILSSYIGA